MKNTKICVILAEYYPQASSNTVCIEPFLLGLLKSGYTVDVYTRRIDELLPAYEVINGINIYRINDNRSIGILKQNAGGKARKYIEKLYYHVRFNGKKGEARYGGWDENAVAAKILENNTKMEYSAIISISYPALTHEIAYSVKNILNDIKWIFIEFDPYAYNVAEYGKFGQKIRLKRESNWMKRADKIMLTRELREFYSKTQFEVFNKKMGTFIFPNFKQLEIDKNLSMLSKSTDVQFVYAGAFSRKIRNPKFMIKTFGAIDINYKLYLLTGNKLNYVKRECDKLGNNIVVLKKQTIYVSQATLSSADFVLSIGNTVEFQTPGKIMECISLGKPLIHFSKLKNDPALFYLKNYPMACIIQEYSMTPVEACLKIKDFVRKYKGAICEFKELEAKMKCLNSVNVVNSFSDSIEEVLKKKNESK